MMYVRSLFSNVGWSKKTQAPRGLLVTCSGEAPQESVGDQRAADPAMGAIIGPNAEAEIKQRT